MVVLKNCEPELSYILADLFNTFSKESCFRDCWKVSLVVPVFKSTGERSTAKSYHPISHLSVVSKVFEKLVNNRLNDLPDVTCKIAIYDDDTTLCSKCGQASDLWQQLESELESNPQDTMNWGRKWLVDFNA